MKFEIENLEYIVENTKNVINGLAGKNFNVKEVLFNLFKENFVTSDIFFMFIGELKKRNYVNSEKDLIELKQVPETELNSIKEFIINRTKRTKRIIITPWDVAKFYICQRRLWLEKIVLSKEYKPEKGKNWDGEALHISVKNVLKGETIEKSVEKTLTEFEGKTISINKEQLNEFLNKVLEFVKSGNIIFYSPEREILSLKNDIFGIPDIVLIDKEINPIVVEIKFGKNENRKDHLIQIVGETILASSFFRTNPIKAYSIYYESNQIKEIEIKKRNINEFIRLKRNIVTTYSVPRIPPLSRIPNFREVVCPHCHVKKACDNIELLRRVRGKRIV